MAATVARSEISAYQKMLGYLPAFLHVPCHLLRCSGLLILNMSIMQVIGALSLVAHHFMGMPLMPSLLTGIALLMGWGCFKASQTPDAGLGARSSRGTGKPELSIEALRSLLSADGDAPAPCEEAGFNYLEVSVQETMDGQLVVLHHLNEKDLRRAFPRKGANATVIESLEGELGCNFEKLAVGEITYDQLRSLDLYGHKGIRVATLDEYLKVCRESGLRKPIAVEIRHLCSDRGRAGVIRVMKQHRMELEGREEEPLLKTSYQELGVASLVIEPAMFVNSFAEFGTVMWAHWSTRLRQADVPIRLKACHWVNLGFMAPDV